MVMPCLLGLELTHAALHHIFSFLEVSILFGASGFKDGKNLFSFLRRFF